ncbi:isochorismatase family protein [Faecalimonas sp.]
MRIRAEDAIAIVIDYQERLMPVMYEKEKLLKNTAILLSGLQELQIPIVVTQQYTKGLGQTVEEIGNVLGQFNYLEKVAFSAFEEIKQVIEGKKYVIVCGIEAHICVLQTLLDLRENGYIPVLVEDCISSRTLHNKQIALERVKQEEVILTTYESVLFELMKTAGTDTFKKIQKLIK